MVSALSVSQASGMIHRVVDVPIVRMRKAGGRASLGYSPGIGV